MVKISVVVAVYNGEKYLRQTLDSILAQTLKDIEIFCVNDQSVDSSLDILREYEKKDNRIHVLENKAVGDGAAKARNFGCAHATGKYLMVLDADDFFEPDMMEKAYLLAEETSAEVVMFDGWIYDEAKGIDEETGVILRRGYLGADDTLIDPRKYGDRLFSISIGAAWHCLFNRDFIERNGIRFAPYYHADDLGFVFLALACADCIALLPERLIHYRRNVPTSQGENAGKWPKAYDESLRQLKDALTMRGLFDTYRVGFAQKAVEYALFYLNKMPTADDFLAFYTELRNSYLQEFGAIDLPEEAFVNGHWRFMRDAIRDYPASEYLFRCMKNLPPFADTNRYKTTVKNLPKGARIAVYGAGLHGKRLATTCFAAKGIQFVAWVDQNYAHIGWPVTSPETLPSARPDQVLVAIEAQSVWETVRRNLMAFGIPGETIHWLWGES